MTRRSLPAWPALTRMCSMIFMERPPTREGMVTNVRSKAKYPALPPRSARASRRFVSTSWVATLFAGGLALVDVVKFLVIIVINHHHQGRKQSDRVTHSLTLVQIMSKNLPKIFDCVYRERQGCKESFGKPMLNTQWRDCEPATKIGIRFKETVLVKIYPINALNCPMLREMMPMVEEAMRLEKVVLGVASSLALTAVETEIR